jgi:hypothetical protein
LCFSPACAGHGRQVAMKIPDFAMPLKVVYLSTKDRAAITKITQTHCNIFFHHEGHEEHEGFVCSKS